MKKHTITLILAAMLVHGYAQSVDEKKFHIQKFTDQMTDIEYFSASEDLLCAGKEMGFRITPVFKMEKGEIDKENQWVVFDGLIIKSAGIGNCVENAEVIFLFEDGTKTSVTSWNKFNCEGKSYFNSRLGLFDFLCKPIKAIRFTNGRTYDSYTHKPVGTQKNFFISVKTAIDNQWIVDKGIIE